MLHIKFTRAVMNVRQPNKNLLRNSFKIPESIRCCLEISNESKNNTKKFQTKNKNNHMLKPYREDICLQTLLLLFKYANHKNKRSFV